MMMMIPCDRSGSGAVDYGRDEMALCVYGSLGIPIYMFVSMLLQRRHKGDHCRHHHRRHRQATADVAGASASTKTTSTYLQLLRKNRAVHRPDPECRSICIQRLWPLPDFSKTRSRQVNTVRDGLLAS